MNCKVCSNTSAKNSSVSFFRFPKENAKCKEWAERCGMLGLFELHGTSRFYKSFRICSDHFDTKDIVFDGRKKRLLQSAVPKVLVSTQRLKEEKPGVVGNVDQNKIFKVKLVENLCRLCAEENKNLTEIYGWRGRVLKLEEKIKYLPLVISEYDILPLRICSLCVSKVNQFHDFILSCMKAETKLRIMCNLEDCTKLIPNDCQEKMECVSGLNITKTPNLELPESPDLETCFQETGPNFYDHTFHDNFMNEHGENCFCKVTETDFTETHQLTNHTNFIRESEFSINNFRYDYSNSVGLRTQIQDNDKIQTEIDQNVVEDTKRSCDIFLKFFPNPDESNTQSLPNSNSNLNIPLFCEASQNVFFARPSDVCPKPNDKTQLKCFLKFDQNHKNLKSKKKFEKRRCQFCDRVFKNLHLCLIHEKIHTGETPYECKQCGKGFRSRASLRQHRSVHSDKRLHTCTECGMSFKRKDTLSNHLRIHTGERPFICQVCGFAFKQRGDCVKHEKNHQRDCESEIPEENTQTELPD